MTTGKYLLELEETFSDNNVATTRHIIEAENRQMVKYHLHRSLETWGYNGTDSHFFESWDMGAIDLLAIRELAPHEWDILSNYLTRWPKE